MQVLLVGALFYYIFAVLAANLLAGKMYYCTNSFSAGGVTGSQMDAYYYLPPGDFCVC